MEGLQVWRPVGKVQQQQDRSVKCNSNTDLESAAARQICKVQQQDRKQQQDRSIECSSKTECSSKAKVRPEVRVVRGGEVGS